MTVAAASAAALALSPWDRPALTHPRPTRTFPFTSSPRASRVLAVAAAAAGTAASSRSSPSSGKRASGANGLRYFRYHSLLPQPVPAKTSYVKRRPGMGWPEQCPPMQAAHAFGWDVVNPFEICFRHGAEGWEIEDATEVMGGDMEERCEITPFDQDNVWQWDAQQILPHRISPHVYKEIRHQAKVSTYLYLKTPPGWVVMMSDIPNLKRRFRTLSAVLDTDWYFPAHPWHCVIELPSGDETFVGDEVVIEKGAPLCRLMPVRRASYSAMEMTSDEFAELFEEGQTWLERHGRPSEDPQAKGALDITKAYKKVQRTASFNVRPTRQ